MTVLPHEPVCDCGEEKKERREWVVYLSGSKSGISKFQRLSERTHRAAILADGVCEAAVALGSDLDVVGASEHHGLLQVAGGGVHVGDAVLAVVCDVLGGLVGHQAHEGHLDVDVLGISSIGAILELQGGERRKVLYHLGPVRRISVHAGSCFIVLDFSPRIHRSWTRWTRRASSPCCSCWGTSSSWGCWTGLGRCRSRQSPCCSGPWWRPEQIPGWGRPSTCLSQRNMKLSSYVSYASSTGCSRTQICTHRSSTRGGTSSGRGTCGQGSSGYRRGCGSSRPSGSGSWGWCQPPCRDRASCWGHQRGIRHHGRDREPSPAGAGWRSRIHCREVRGVQRVREVLEDPVWRHQVFTNCSNSPSIWLKQRV